jgi:ABC-type multidrug transport system fused ATPase/permease subunit
MHIKKWQTKEARPSMKEKEKSLAALPLLKRLWKISRHANIWLLVACLFVIVSSLVSVYLAHVLGQTVDAATATGAGAWTGTGNNSADVWRVLLLLGALTVSLSPLAFATTWFSGRYAENVLAQLRSLIATKTAGLPVRFLEKNHSGKLMTLMSSDLAKIKTMLNTDFTGILERMTLMIATLVYMIRTDWQLTLVTLTISPLLLLLMSVVTKPLTRQTIAMQESVADVNSLAQDSLSGHMLAKSFNLQNVLSRAFARKTDDVVHKANKIAKTNAIVMGVSIASQMAPFLILFGFGGYQVIGGRISPGEFFAFIQLMNNITNSLGLLPNHFASIKEAVGSVSRIFELLDQNDEPAGGDIMTPVADYQTAISFNNVSFHYDDQDKEVLGNVSFDVLPGETVAIVGPSGSGKSTLSKLLLGFYPVTHGTIGVMGHSLKDWNTEALRSNMAFVAQDTYLFPASIGANIACGRSDWDQGQIEEAAKIANINDDIQALPDSYQTEVGERGMRLSGGQRQRVAIARAILRSAPILLLDEATSALDNESELLVQEALERAIAGRTTLVIAHRLSTIKNADRIIVLDEGRIVEQGTHEDLLNRHGLYEKLFLRQFQLNQEISENRECDNYLEDNAAVSKLGGEQIA